MTRLPSDDHAGLGWIKALASQSIGMCVEIAPCSDGVAVRHSMNPEDGAILFSRDEFRAFLDGAKNGEFDHLV
jgi:hypothetical protein